MAELKKISPLGVARDSWALCAQRPGIFVAFMILAFVGYIPAMMINVYGMATPPLWDSLNLAYLFLLAPVLELCLLHIYVSLHDGALPSLLPSRLVKKSWQMLWRTWVFFGGFFVLFVLLYAAAMIFLGMDQMGEGPDEPLHPLGIAIMLCLGAAFVLCVCRYGFIFPAIAAGEDASLGRSWRLSSGHGWRLCLFMFPYLFIMIPVESFVEAGTSAAWVLSVIVSSASSALAVFLMAAGSVWYRKFIQREQRLQVVTSTVVEVADYGQSQD